MKELSIKEKAKAYDKAIERAKELLEIGLKDTRDKRVVLSFFPELRESEDEKIKEALIQLVKCNERSGYLVLNNVSTGSMIAWLEKQGEKSQRMISAEAKEAMYDKTAWSEEDDIGLDDALWCCQQAASIAKDENDIGNTWYAEKWLKSLKQRLGE